MQSCRFFFVLVFFFFFFLVFSASPLRLRCSPIRRKLLLTQLIKLHRSWFVARVSAYTSSVAVRVTPASHLAHALGRSGPNEPARQTDRQTDWRGVLLSFVLSIMFCVQADGIWTVVRRAARSVVARSLCVWRPSARPRPLAYLSSAVALKARLAF